MNDPRLNSAFGCLSKTVAKLDKGFRTEPNFRHRQKAMDWTLTGAADPQQKGDMANRTCKK